MDSPEPVSSNTNTTTTTIPSAPSASTLSDSPPVQESPFSNYVSTLSPIKPVKGALVAQGFLGLGSPPLVFSTPRLLPHRETSFLQSAGTPKNDDVSKKCVDVQDGSGQSAVTHLISDLIPEPAKDNDAQDQPGSSSGCFEEYLAEPAEMDCANSGNSENSNVKQSSHELELSTSGLTDSNNNVLKSDDKSIAKVDVPQAMPEIIGEDTQGQLSSEIEQVKFEDEKTMGDQPSKEIPDIGSDFPVDDAVQRQGAEAHENPGENVGDVVHESVQNIVQPDHEAIQIQRGMSRRCLQFEEAKKNATLSSTLSPNLTNNTSGLEPSASFSKLEISGISHHGISGSSDKNKMLNLLRPMASTLPQHSEKSPSSVSKPSGIGLHLNSIINKLPMGHSATASTKSVSSISFRLVENERSCLKSSNLVENVELNSEDKMLEMKTPLAATSAVSDSFANMKSLNGIPTEHQVTPYNKRKFSSEDGDNFEELNQSSPKKKRKKLSSNEADGCKRCNCKKTQCLKLYCDCFAAGIYCADPCACQGCLNRPEYEETVLETRQQIESRNPLAFAPKVVGGAAEFPIMNGEDANQFTPLSARHKRGCNCKKSMCLKKYCECYQANVGCSNGCRCEGCKNVYGRKEDYMPTEERVSNRASDKKLESTVDDKLAMVVHNKDFLHSELYDLHNLAPLTPSFQCTDHGNDAGRFQLPYGRYLTSPESDLSMLPSYSKPTASPGNSFSNDMLPDSRKETLDIGSYDEEMDYNIVEMIDQFSPKGHALDAVYDLTPLPNSSSITMASSASSKTRDWLDVSRMQSCPRTGRLSSGSALRWRTSPITPMTRLGESKGQGLCNILEDDTPEILKEASTPNAKVKVSSPNKKRVSPPRSHIHELRPSSSVGLKSGRKFILKALPSFPPLSPCANSKGKSNQKESC